MILAGPRKMLCSLSSRFCTNCIFQYCTVVLQYLRCTVEKLHREIEFLVGSDQSMQPEACCKKPCLDTSLNLFTEPFHSVQCAGWCKKLCRDPCRNGFWCAAKDIFSCQYMPHKIIFKSTLSTKVTNDDERKVPFDPQEFC